MAPATARTPKKKLTSLADDDKKRFSLPEYAKNPLYRR
jgi:hypothetical protein